MIAEMIRVPEQTVYRWFRGTTPQGKSMQRAAAAVRLLRLAVDTGQLPALDRSYAVITETLQQVAMSTKQNT